MTARTKKLIIALFLETVGFVMFAYATSWLATVALLIAMTGTNWSNRINNERK